MTHVLLKLEEESSGIFFEIKSLKGSYPNSFKPGAPADIMDSLNIGSSIIWVDAPSSYCCEILQFYNLAVSSCNFLTTFSWQGSHVN